MPRWRDRSGFTTPYQYTEAQAEGGGGGGGAGWERVWACMRTGEPGTLYAAEAGVASIDHATQLSDETMRLMKEKQIFAVPTFTIFEYFAEHAASPARRRGSGRCWTTRCASSSGRWRRGCRWRWVRMWGRFRMGRRRGSWS